MPTYPSTPSPLRLSHLHISSWRRATQDTHKQTLYLPFTVPVTRPCLIISAPFCEGMEKSRLESQETSATQRGQDTISHVTSGK